ncbi:hypothetical protein MUK42_06340 [Musa troglodytarum]|uniref:Uncharacterized protein n=1 Tax=Musa troglodytarum TaxID=320322 RepID=A0A9E7KBW4_9LILI|nr:hypothetical protein MUK42_06340 [Musa troglodytarum]
MSASHVNRRSRVNVLRLFRVPVFDRQLLEGRAPALLSPTPTNNDLENKCFCMGSVQPHQVDRPCYSESNIAQCSSHLLVGHRDLGKPHSGSCRHVGPSRSFVASPKGSATIRSSCADADPLADTAPWTGLTTGQLNHYWKSSGRRVSQLDFTHRLAH